MAFHATWGCSDGPFPGENGYFESGHRRMEFVKGKTIPCKLCSEKVTGKGFDVAGEGCAERNCWGVEEEKSWNGEENDEEKGGAETGMGSRNGFLGFGVEGHVWEIGKDGKVGNIWRIL